MSNERDELARIIFNYNGLDAMVGEQDLGAAEAILKAGYRRPHVVTTHAELDALPVGAAVIDDEPPVWLWTKNWESKHPRKDGTPLSKWHTRGHDEEYETIDVPLPATVVWMPTSG